MEFQSLQKNWTDGNMQNKQELINYIKHIFDSIIETTLTAQQERIKYRAKQRTYIWIICYKHAWLKLEMKNPMATVQLWVSGTKGFKKQKQWLTVYQQC